MRGEIGLDGGPRGAGVEDGFELEAAEAVFLGAGAPLLMEAVGGDLAGFGAARLELGDLFGAAGSSAGALEVLGDLKAALAEVFKHTRCDAGDLSRALDHRLEGHSDVFGQVGA